MCHICDKMGGAHGILFLTLIANLDPRGSDSTLRVASPKQVWARQSGSARDNDHSQIAEKQFFASLAS